ncbi:MAG: DUF4189 domain-containing protein [Alphaproteobacteria bacterium]|nr:MAG: DUF4189 domain-containing protein [Alphaproteobacteria bacterium]
MRNVSARSIDALLACTVVCLLFASVAVTAQTACPGGVAPGSAQCGPSPASHVAPRNAQPEVRYVHTGTWKDSWGAIAVDAAAGAGGSAKDMRLESEARTKALIECSKHGALNCEVLLVFKNQCAVLAWPSDEHAKVVSSNGSTVEEASTLALSTCAKTGGSCEVVYTACSDPIFEKR